MLLYCGKSDEQIDFFPEKVFSDKLEKSIVFAGRL